MSGIIDTIGELAAGAENLIGGTKSNDPKDELSIVVGTQKISGWTRIRATLGIEHIPNSFEVEFTENYPGSMPLVTVLAGSPCQVMIGADLILTGYVDSYSPSFDSDSHSIKVTGRGKCQDLVDCSAEWPSGQISGTDARDVANKLCKPYSIKVNKEVYANVGAMPLPVIPQFNLIYGETAGEIIDRICKYSALLYYEMPDGSLQLSQVGTEDMASGFTEGINVQRATSRFTMDQRYSVIRVAIQSTAPLKEVQHPELLFGESFDPNIPPGFDNLPRHRQKVVISESGSLGREISLLRAAWEVKRRFGRSFQIELTTDSWRDSAKALWKPNSNVLLSIPSMKIVDKIYVIGEVTFIRDEENGTIAELTLMPPEAFTVEPIRLQPQPIMEANQAINVPGGNQNPAAPALPPAVTSPATSAKDARMAGFFDFVDKNQ